MSTAATAIAPTQHNGANPAPRPAALEAVERTLVQGDLSRLTADERLVYYREVCQTLGLNPLTQPFQYLTLKGGKLQLYPTKDCAAQLRRLHAVSLEIVSREIVQEVLFVRVRATLPGAKGMPKRVDEDEGAVSVQGLAGEDVANAVLKAITKAKRRATLSVCGLGFLDGPDEEMPEQRPPAVQAGVVGPPAAPALPAPGPDDAQIEGLRQLKAALGIDQAGWAAILSRRGVRSARELSMAQAVDLAVKLREKLLAQKAQAHAADQPAASAALPAYAPGSKEATSDDDIPF